MDTLDPANNDWHGVLQEWFKPFLAVFRRYEQRYSASHYLHGLLGPSARKSVEPMAERARRTDAATSSLRVEVTVAYAPIEQVLRKTADVLPGGKDAVPTVDDTALPKQGKHSIGVQRQHCGVLHKQAHCHVPFSLTLAYQEVPVPVALRLYLPQEWAQDKARRAAAKVPESITFETKGDIALADAGYGSSAAFRASLTQRELL